MKSYKNLDGYIIYKIWDNAIKTYREISEHAYVMQNYLGRTLPKGTIVHHRNRKRHDNRIENLLLMRSAEDHRELHKLINENNTDIIRVFEEWCLEFMNKLKAGIPEEECYKSTPKTTHINNTSPDNILFYKNKKELQRSLFSQLKKERLRISQELNIPAYIVFHNKTLVEMSIKMPDTTETLLKIKGVGPEKIQKYGESFLKIIKEFIESHAA